MRVKIKSAILAFAVAVGLAMPGSAIESQTPARASSAATGRPAPISSPALPALTKADADAWLDGMIPAGIQTGDIAGAVVVIVKDGQVLTARGYGYADKARGVRVDPGKTLFRPGSVSKLFTWTAVMQLVEQGKVDLDADINTYLDFRIPPKFGKPITMRHLMTHTPGFEETVKYLILTDPKAKPSLERGLKRWVPTRIYAPGSTPAYSNYGTALAGYIVQRVSGQRFEDYVQTHIFTPIGMTHSTFEQFLPPALAATMSQGYQVASAAPMAFERLDLGPAGALSGSGMDMGRFMISHLDRGAGLLKPETADQMHRVVNRPFPGLPGMALGFYHEDRSGVKIFGHGGDTNWFHSDLHLYPESGVGIFVSFNSLGKEGAAYPLRTQLFDQFTNRYFATLNVAPKTDANARRYAEAVAGSWEMSRGGFTTWISMTSVVQPIIIERNEDDTISVSVLRDVAGNVKKWRSIGPWRWQEVGGDEQLAARVEGGKPVALASAQFAPIIEMHPAPASRNGAVIVPILAAATAVVFLTALAWPIVALVRRRYGYVAPLARRDLQWHRASRIGAWLLLAVVIGWAWILNALGNDVSLLDGRLDPWMRLFQLFILIGMVGSVAAIVRAVTMIRRGGGGWFAKLWAILFAMSCAALCWILIGFKTLTLSLAY